MIGQEILRRPGVAIRKKNFSINVRPKSSLGASPSFKPALSSRTLIRNNFSNKARTSRNHIDKESLYDLTSNLKEQLAKFKVENIQLRTRSKFLQSEVDKFENIYQNQGNPRFASTIGLRRLYSETKLALQAKSEEVEDIRRDIKSTQINELTVELQVVTDEWKRLRRVLEEITREQYPTCKAVEVESWFDMKSQIIDLKKDLEIALERNSGLEQELQYWKRNQISSSTTPKHTRLTSGRTSRLSPNLSTSKPIKLGVMSLPDFKNSTNHIKKQSQNNFDGLLAQKGPAAIWESFNKNEKPVTLDQFEKGLKNLSCEDENAGKLYSTITAEHQALTFNSLKEYYFKSFRPNSWFENLSMVMQAKRYELIQLPELIFGKALDKTYQRNDLEIVLTSPPLELNRDVAWQIINAVFQQNTELGFTLATRISTEMPIWNLITEAEEKAYDKTLREIIGPKLEKLQDQCKKLDTDDTGVISINHWDSICHNLGIVLEGGVKKYTELLFFSGQQELGSVPYKSFLEAYG